MTAALVAFLALHGLLHAAIWLRLPHPEPDPGKPPPFHPDHSAVLTVAHAPATVVRRLSIALALASTATYLLAAVALAVGARWAAPVAVAAALIAFALKIFYFHPWLLIGITLDVLVVLAATAGWPVTLS